MKGEILTPESWDRADREQAARVTHALRCGVGHFVDCGNELIAAKDRMEHGRFERWIEEFLPISGRSVRQFMQIARDPNVRRYVDDLRQHVAVLPADRLVLTELCGLEPEQFDGLIENGVIHAEMRRGDLKRHLVAREHEPPAGEPPPLPDGKYGAILADPPWRFETRGAGGKGRSAESHYPTMTLGEIEAMPVLDLAADDSALFLWVTSDMLLEAAGLMAAWGFELKSTAFIWVKQGAPGLGYWTRKGAEICLLGTRGSPKRLNADVAEVIHAPRREHSQKPEEAYARIERLVAGPYLDLFGRKPREGWTVWGNDPALREEAE